VQSCTFVSKEGNTQTNTGTGAALIFADRIVLSVEGEARGVTVAHVPYAGGYRGTWTLTR